MHLKYLYSGIGFIIISFLHLILKDNYLKFRERNSPSPNWNKEQSENIIYFLIIGFFIFGIIFICVSFF